ncbi:DUF2147 domain-containing protein [Donghicola tyrosinivorans]|uniref:Uncharacterized protein (DUF2147 family) n=1 Tax=Donghicola tyrosinivorans TaxID=1652492 RepID=A0A2T0WWX1_9RHOB|nr:DUF2147 domain-containing protein [Donghicola tyrosinivorans]PRY91188.1 uncharacterized protein (DUF2147 family) [Donghicola tyrosinivorans]
MKQFILGAALALAAGAAHAEGVNGTWQTETSDKGAYLHVDIGPCGDKVCGVIAKVVNGDESITGKNIIWDMSDQGGGAFGGGQIWAPDTDKTYKSKMSLEGNGLKVSGCVLGGVICRSQNWARVN